MTKVNDPILESWEKTRTDTPDRAAVFDSQGKVVRTFVEIEERAHQWADELATMAPGQVLALQIGNHPDWPSLFLACLRKQIVVLPLEQTISAERRENALELCRASAIATLSSRARSRDPGKVTLKITQRDSSTEVRDDRLALLKLTSGTTAAPRAIRFRSDQLLADCENICETMGITGTDINFGVIPISHSYGFSNLLTPLIVRGVAAALSNDRIPRAIIDGLTISRTTVFPGMPVFYQSFCEMNTAPALPSLRLCISAGAPLPPETAELFHEKFGQEIHSFYGASECGGVFFVRPGEP